MRSFPSVIPSIWSYSALISRHAKGRSKGPPNAEKMQKYRSEQQQAASHRQKGYVVESQVRSAKIQCQQLSHLLVITSPSHGLWLTSRLVVGQAVENDDAYNHNEQPDGYYYEQYEAKPSQYHG